MAKHETHDDKPAKKHDVKTESREIQPDGETCHCDALAVPHVHTPTGVEYAKD